jgi:type II secretory ATPase GspE/PulE/Tfp pilus assembly ATPase PilB-like protein
LLKLAGIDAENLYRGEGCPECDHTGFSGRTIIAELFSSDPGLEDLIMKRESNTAIAAYLRSRGVQGLLYEGLRKAAAGITTLAEVEREIVLSPGDE